jgi:hypothetical protein
MINQATDVALYVDNTAFHLRGLRKGHAWENGDGYLSS